MRVTSDQAFEWILRGETRADLVVEGSLDFAHVSRPLRLPPRLVVAGTLTLTGATITELPDGLNVWGALRAERCPTLARVGRIRAGSLDVSDSRALRIIDEGARIKDQLTTDRCVRLERLPSRLSCERISVRDCTRLRELPRDIRAEVLDLRGCSGLQGETPARAGVLVDELTRVPYNAAHHRVHADTARHWLGVGRARTGLHVNESLHLRGSGYVDALPDPLIVDGDLNLNGCMVRRLPQRIEVSGLLDLTGVTGVRDVPAGWSAREIRLPNGSVRQGQSTSRQAAKGAKSAASIAWLLARLVWSAARSGAPPTPSHGLLDAEALNAIRNGESHVVVLGDLSLRDIRDLARLPASLWVHGNLHFKGNERLTALPDDLRVTGTLSLSDCPALTRLPERLSVGELSIWRCPQLTELPRGLACKALTVSECAALERVPVDAIVANSLSVSKCPRVSELPPELVLAEQLALSDLPSLGSLPASIRVRDLRLRDLPGIREIGPGVSFQTAEIANLPALERLPATMEARYLRIRRAEQLRVLPPSLRVSESLSLGELPGVTSIPDGTAPRHVECVDAPLLTSLPMAWRGLRALDLSRCPALADLPPRLSHIAENLELRGCASLRALPADLAVRGRLDLEGCGALEAIPGGMPPPMAAEIGGTALTGLPASWQIVQLTWRRVAVTAAMVFETSRMAPAEILAEANAELRAVLIERYGFARLLAGSNPIVVDCDTDAGGPRALVSVQNGPGDSLVGLKVHCPSTGRLFFFGCRPGSEAVTRRRHGSPASTTRTTIVPSWRPDDAVAARRRARATDRDGTGRRATETRHRAVPRRGHRPCASARGGRRRRRAGAR
jgi:hypothetical protein